MVFKPGLFSSFPRRFPQPDFPKEIPCLSHKAAFRRKNPFVKKASSAFPLALAVLLACPQAHAQSAGRQQLHGHVPKAVATAPLVGDMPAAEQLHLAIGLPLRNPEALQSLLKDLYDPKSPNYRHFLKPEEFDARFGPAPADYQAVMDFARSNGLKVTQTHHSRMLLGVSGAVADIQKAFHVRLRNYRRPDGTTFHAPDAEPSVDLDVPLQYISGLDNYARIRPTWTGSYASSGGNLYIGNDFRAAYAPGVSNTGAGQTIALFELDQYYPADITVYNSLAYPTPSPTPPVP